MGRRELRARFCFATVLASCVLVSPVLPTEVEDAALLRGSDSTRVTVLPSGVAARAEIARLEAQWRGAANPDSIRFRLALARREEGSLENRLLALDTLGELVRSHPGQREYAWERAQTFLRCGQPSNALRTFERMLASDSLDVPVRIEIARLRIQEVIRHYDLRETDRILDLLEGTRELAPDLVDNLILSSFVYYLAAKRPGADPLLLAELGRVHAESAEALRPDDPRGALLRGVHLAELRRWDEADLLLQATIAKLRPEDRQVFERIPFGVDASLRQRWEEMGPAERLPFVEGVWRGRDPTPLTPVNENRIEYWARVVICDLLFGNAHLGIPGWQTDPGHVFLRYGLPTENVYSPGAMEELASDMMAHPWETLIAGRRLQTTFDFDAPSWKWRYEFPAGGAIELEFEDIDFQGTFRRTDDTNELLVALEKVAPTIYDAVLPGRIQRIFTRVPALAGTDSTTAQWVEVALPPWLTPRPESWWDEATLEVVVRDRMSRPVAFSKRKLGTEHLYRPLDGGELIVHAERFDLAPGEYWVETNVVDGRIGEHGSRRTPLTVRRFGESQIELSDLRLVAARMTDGGGKDAALVPSPVGWVAGDRKLQVSFEVYTQLAGPRRVQVRYTILPKAYLLTIRERIRRAELRADDARTLGGIGMQVGSVLLTRENYSDVLFPEESIVADVDGRIPRRAALDLVGLIPGEYAVVATVTDLASSRTASSLCLVRVVTDEELRGLLDP